MLQQIDRLNTQKLWKTCKECRDIFCSESTSQRLCDDCMKIALHRCCECKQHKPITRMYGKIDKHGYFCLDCSQKYARFLPRIIFSMVFNWKNIPLKKCA
jgi:hypothetical protein